MNRTFAILPAIDLHNGQCVRLRCGDFNSVHKVAEDPVAVAEGFIADGAEIIHVVDLNASRDGRRANGGIIGRLCALDVKIELGGGLRSMADLAEASGIGVWRMVVGSAAVKDPGFVAEAVKAYGARIAVGIDALGDDVKTDGWLAGSGKSLLETALQMESLGVQTLIYTDIAKDGLLQGPNIERFQALRQALSCQLIASGGVSVPNDLHTLRSIGANGAIVGKAIYAKQINLAQAIAEHRTDNR